MNEQQPPDGISVEDWQATPESVCQLVLALLVTVEQLQQEVPRLREQVNQSSQNSSKPPSSDPPLLKRKPPVKKGQRKRGGQPGHQGKGRRLKPPEQVSRFVFSRPTTCGACGALLLGQDPQPSRHQVTELPHIEPEVVEYQLHCLCCLACGQEPVHEFSLGLIEVAPFLRNLQPVAHGFDVHLVYLLPLLLVMVHFLSVAVVQVAEDQVTSSFIELV